MPEIIDIWADEDERDVVNELCNSFSALLMSVGPASIVPECTLNFFLFRVIGTHAHPYLQTFNPSANKSPSSSSERQHAKSTMMKMRQPSPPENNQNTMPLSSVLLATSLAPSPVLSVPISPNSSLPSNPT